MLRLKTADKSQLGKTTGIPSLYMEEGCAGDARSRSSVDNGGASDAVQAVHLNKPQGSHEKAARHLSFCTSDDDIGPPPIRWSPPVSQSASFLPAIPVPVCRSFTHARQTTPNPTHYYYPTIHTGCILLPRLLNGAAAAPIFFHPTASPSHPHLYLTHHANPPPSSSIQHARLHTKPSRLHLSNPENKKKKGPSPNCP